MHGTIVGCGQLDSPGVWSEPVGVDGEGARRVALRMSDEAMDDDVLLVDRPATSSCPAKGKEDSQARRLQQLRPRQVGGQEPCTTKKQPGRYCPSNGDGPSTQYCRSTQGSHVCGVARLISSHGRAQVWLWVVVERAGRETVVSLHGGCSLRNHLPVPVDIRLSTMDPDGQVRNPQGTARKIRCWLSSLG